MKLENPKKQNDGDARLGAIVLVGGMDVVPITSSAEFLCGLSMGNFPDCSFCSFCSGVYNVLIQAFLPRRTCSTSLAIYPGFLRGNHLGRASIYRDTSEG